MNSRSKLVVFVVSAVIGHFPAPALAQQSAGAGVDTWRSLDEDFRQAIVDEISRRRGLDPNSQNPDWLIRTPEDISEVLRASCDISGACAEEEDRETLAEYLGSFPEYDEQQGLLNAASLRRMKSGNEH